MERRELPRYPVIDIAATGQNLRRLRLEKAVPFGQPATGFLPTEEELVSALRPVVGWTPSPDLPLFQDTTFEPIYQDTEEPGLLRWRWTR